MPDPSSRVRFTALALAVTIVGCAHVATHPVVLSVTGVDCFECAARFMPQIQSVAGAHHAEFDKQRVEVRIDAAPSFDVHQAIAVVEAAGFHATVGAGHGKYVAGADYPDSADAKVAIDDGADVPDLSRLLVRGKVTVIDFYADWCGPCKDVDKHLAAAIAGRADLAVRKLNIVDWDSPLARHYAGTLTSLPAQIVFARDGRKVATIIGLDLPALDRAITDGAR